MHALWQCPMVSPLWRNVLDVKSEWLECDLPSSPKLCLLGDKTVVPQLSKFRFKVLITGLITFAWLILRCWKESQTPTLKIETGSIEQYDMVK